MTRSSVFAVVALVLSLAAGACDDGSPPPATPGADAHTVTIERFTFMPQRIEVEAGTSVTFVNRDEVLHTVTAGTPGDPMPWRFDGQLDGVGADDARFDLTLDEPGTYPFFCTRHAGVPGMQGTVVVSR